jgi:hypothetical protein
MMWFQEMGRMRLKQQEGSYLTTLWFWKLEYYLSFVSSMPFINITTLYQIILSGCNSFLPLGLFQSELLVRRLSLMPIYSLALNRDPSCDAPS